MTNKQQIEKLKDNAELAQAAYGYFDCVGNKFDIKNEDKFAALENILDITYKDSKIIDEWGFRVGTLKGDFTPLKAKRFFERYDLLIHQPNTESDFSNVLSHKGKEHRLLAQWVERTRFKAHRLDFSYKNCNYHTKRMESCEVFITNITHNFTQKGRV